MCSSPLLKDGNVIAGSFISRFKGQEGGASVTLLCGIILGTKYLMTSDNCMH